MEPLNELQLIGHAIWQRVLTKTILESSVMAQILVIGESDFIALQEQRSDDKRSILNEPTGIGFHPTVAR